MGSRDIDVRTVPTGTRAGREVAAAIYALTVVEGPDRGLRYQIDGTSAGPTLVGQSDACHLRLSDRQVSRRHVTFDLADRELRLTDLGSTNRTLVNGIVVVEALLRGGELVQVGQTILRVDVVAPETSITISEAASFGRLVGKSAAMRRLYPLCERLAATDLTVLVEGETGTGKELLAESLHELGPRANGPFVVFDCTAVAPNLIESELFGHERGAFTGALATRKGVFEQAHGGTLLIDEVGDLPAPLQPKLLRALERSEVRRIGGDRALKVDVRVLAATRRDLDREVQEGRFRDDLYHRLVVARVELPPLRRRKGDVALLAAHIATTLGYPASALPEQVVRGWEADPWPGNVRELRNTVTRRLMLGELAATDGAEPIEPSHTAGEGVLEQAIARGLPFSTARTLVLDELERRYVAKALAEHGGNVTRAAAASGLARRYFQKVMQRVRS
jgi:two-component system, NtrC family, response regulator HydG